VQGTREELTAYVSIGFMGLVGLAVYSGSYSITMAMGLSPRVVPVLEMWFVFGHLLCCAACLLLQARPSASPQCALQPPSASPQCALQLPLWRALMLSCSSLFGAR
jgi:hypothetical protein